MYCCEPLWDRLWLGSFTAAIHNAVNEMVVPHCQNHLEIQKWH